MRLLSALKNGCRNDFSESLTTTLSGLGEILGAQGEISVIGDLLIFLKDSRLRLGTIILP
jgi:hypothetical protein